MNPENYSIVHWRGARAVGSRFSSEVNLFLLREDNSVLFQVQL